MHHIYFILEWQSTYFGRSFRPSSGFQDCTYSNQTDTAVCSLASSQQYLSDTCLLLCVQLWTVDDGRKDRPKHIVSSQNKINLMHWYIWLVVLLKYITMHCPVKVNVCIYIFWGEERFWAGGCQGYVTHHSYLAGYMWILARFIAGADIFLPRLGFRPTLGPTGRYSSPFPVSWGTGTWSWPALLSAAGVSNFCPYCAVCTWN